MTLKRLAPGVYAEDGVLHLDAAELCAAAGYEPTQENQDRLERTAREMWGTRVRHKSGSVVVLSHRKADDTGWWLRDDQGGLVDWTIDGKNWTVI